MELYTSTLPVIIHEGMKHVLVLACILWDTSLNSIHATKELERAVLQAGAGTVSVIT